METCKGKTLKVSIEAELQVQLSNKETLLREQTKINRETRGEISNF
jgi:hypothetical protein